MRQRLLLISLIASALLVGGWSDVLAVVLCPHAGSAGRATATVAAVDESDAAVGSGVVVVVSQEGETHACCAMKVRAGETVHCGMSEAKASHSASHDEHDATQSMTPPQQINHVSGLAHHAETQHDDNAAATAQANATAADAHASTSSSPCTHCMSRSGQTRVAVRMHEPNPVRRDAADADPRAERTPDAPPLVFISTAARQRGAPPGNRARRHLLNSIFLI
jgi:hypothetical protein